MLPAALKLQQVLGHRPALVFFTQQVGSGHTDVLEKHLALLDFAIEARERGHRDARSGHIDQQEADPRLWFHILVSAHQTEDPVGVVCHAGPDLCAVDHVFVTIKVRCCFQRGKIRTGARLGIALTPHVITRDDAGKKLGFLRLGAKMHKHGSQHLYAHHHRVRRVGQLALLKKDIALLNVPARAAVLHRPLGRTPAFSVQDALPLATRFEIGEHAGRALARPDELGGQRLFQKRPNGRSESLVVSGYGIGSIHGSYPLDPVLS